MKKIGILTINDYSNYGNRLQNYAVQEVLKELGTDPTTVVNLTKTEKNLGTDSEPPSEGASLGQTYKVVKRKLYNGLHRKKITEAKEEKIRKFKTFTADYIKETDYSFTVAEVPASLNDEFDLFVTGSDQVWNPAFKHFSEIDFLTFASAEKRVAYSPSFGVSEIPQSVEADFVRWIDGMAHLSVREEAGARIIKDLTGRDADVLVDPTMMLDQAKWLEVARPFKHKPAKPYMCTYFLGETYLEKQSEIKKIARDNDLILINLGNQYDLKQYAADPAEFLDFIASSELFLTDSFHGTIFSILFKKPFIVFDRKSKLPSMSSRIDTILSKFDLQSRKWDTIRDQSDFLTVDYSHVEAVLNAEREKTRRYLTKAVLS